MDTNEMKWEPTIADVQNYIKEQGWETFDMFKFDHLSEKEALILSNAIKSARAFIEEIKDGKTPSMILLSGAVDGDITRTGYGCGKTTLAKIIYRMANYVQYVSETKDIWVHSLGKIYSSRELMALFEDSDKAAYAIKNLKRLIIIDDIGREGTLQWEKRDPTIQAEEKQDRYYTVINHCYENEISVAMTSNMSSRELADFLGGASWSRLLQMCPKRYRINMTGIPDMRPLLADSDYF